MRLLASRATRLIRLIGAVRSQRTRTILTPPSPGGTPCPPTVVYYQCNTWYCGSTMYGSGYYGWGPIQGTGQTIVISVEAWQYPVDIFVFNNYNYQQSVSPLLIRRLQC